MTNRLERLVAEDPERHRGFRDETGRLFAVHDMETRQFWRLVEDEVTGNEEWLLTSDKPG